VFTREQESKRKYLRRFAFLQQSGASLIYKTSKSYELVNMYANNCDGVNLKHNKAFLFFSCSFDLLLLIAVQLELVFFFLFFFFVLRNAFCLSSHRFVCFADQTLFTISMPRRVENIQSNTELT